MSLNPGGSGNYGWRYALKHEDRELEMWGTVVAMQEKQAREYNPGSNQPGRPKTWPDGNPVMNIRVAFATPDGSLKTIEFNMAGKKQRNGEKPSLHMQLFNLSGGNMTNLIGKTLHLWTWDADPETGRPWGQGNPRKFGAELVEGTKYELASELPDEFKVSKLYLDDGAQGGQPVPAAPQQIQAPQMQGAYYAAPAAQPAYQQPVPQTQPYMAPAPAQAAPVAQQQYAPVQQAPMGVGAPAPAPATQVMPPQAQAVSAPMPQGMDPAVAQAMQAVGATNVQPVIDGQTSVYDDDIPF